MVLFLTMVLPSCVHAQSYIETFGQNRSQYRKFDWKFFDTKHFRVYHYDKAGRQLGRYVAEDAEKSIPIIEKKLGGQFPKRFNIILYNTYEEYRQSNIGLKDESQVTGNVKAGTLNLVGDKLVVYFTGEHGDLHHQIRSGMARIVMERQFFGDKFTTMVKNALLLNLPDWVTEGYISYLVDGWDAKTNSQWKGLLDARPDAGFFQLSEEYPELAGKAFWKFISEQYGPGMVKNLLYSMQQKTGLNKAMLDKENLGIKVTKAYDSCITFYKEVYLRDAKVQEKPDSSKGIIAIKVPKDNSVIKDIRVSPRGSDISYVAWKEGKFTVYTQKTSNEQVQAILLEGGMKDFTEQTDPDYPMMCWSTNGNKLAMLYKKGFRTCLRIYNSQTARIENYIIKKNKFDRILSIAFMQDDDQMVFSAIRKSQTDLYLFTIKGEKLTNITDDLWDDVSPVCISGGSRQGILFLSNRPKPSMNVSLGVNELPTGPMNVFFYNTRTKSTELLQCTDVKTGHGTQPIQYGLENFAYLYDSNGINNKYVVLFKRNSHNKDSAYSVPITNYTSSIISQQYNLASGDVADVVQVKDKYMVYFHNLQMPGQSVQVKTLVPTILSVEKPAEKTKTNTGNNISRLPYHAGRYNNEDEQPTSPSIKSGNAFQTEFSDTTTAPVRKPRPRINNIFTANTAPDSSILTEITDSAYLKMKPTTYRLSFKPDFFSVKLDNSVLFSQYQSIASNGGQFINPSLGGLVTISLNELMENIRITGGFQLPLDNTGSTYFLQYQNFTKRLDWGLLFLRSQDKEKLGVSYYDQNGLFVTAAEQTFKSVANMAGVDFSYPLDRVRSIRFHTALKQDRLVEKVTDTLSLGAPVPTLNKYTSLSRMEYVFDNTISPVSNILNGTRFKIYAEYMYGLNAGNQSCYNLGLDIRNYVKIYKNFILANRLAYAHSDGSSEVEYLLGGVDNWLGPKKGPNAYASLPSNYGFQAMETSIRGYNQYGRIGNNFLSFNTELRLPIVATFVNRPIKSTVLKNLQLVAFLDCGDAWRGFLPDVANNNSTFFFMNPPPGPYNVNVTAVIPNSGGLALGFGPGLRTSILGYFIRLDAAWNIETTKPIIYLSLGSDF